MKNEIKKGILYIDDKPVFALGASYYPSFLESKYPVPEDGDRVGEMKKDLRYMKDIGLNFYRTAALGTVSMGEDGEAVVECDFIDSMVTEAENIGIASSVRLNGYFVNFSNNKNYTFINSRGETMENVWNAFMRGSLHHYGFLKDNAKATIALAKHFDDFGSVVSYQIYNEPHYPFNGVFDYNPVAISAYKKWLVEQGIMSEEEAQAYVVPNYRPRKKEDIEMWINWRLFAQRSMSAFLNKTAEEALSVSHNKDTYTCYTAAPCADICPNFGITYFDDAESLTTNGITLYTPFDGADFFAAAYVVAFSESSAAVSGKRAWTIELDKRTKMPTSKFYRETYEVIGAGHKGICYYAWRGDYPDPKSPNPDNCGFLHYDGTKTKTFDNDIKLINLINKYTHRIVTADKVRTGVCILHSEHSMMYFDALSDPELGGKNFYNHMSLRTYTELKKYGFAPDFLRCQDIESSPLKPKVIFVPTLAGLSVEEIEILTNFAKADKSHLVLIGEQNSTWESIAGGGYRDILHPHLDWTREEFTGGLEVADWFEQIDILPPVETNHKNLFAHTLQNEQEKVIILVSNRPIEKSIPEHDIKLNFEANTVTMVSHNNIDEKTLEINSGVVHLPEISDGAILFVR